jgi:hypothetical protein
MVSFVSSELAEAEPDLIVAFAIIPPNDPLGLSNLILLRTPKYEVILPPEEQGVSVSYDGNRSDEKGFLRGFNLEGDEAQVRTEAHQYSLDLSRVEREEVDLMREALKRMNFDDGFETKGI